MALRHVRDAMRGETPEDLMETKKPKCQRTIYLEPAVAEAVRKLAKAREWSENRTISHLLRKALRV